MNAITSIIPSSRPVRIARAGFTVQVSEFTLRDLADLQAVLDAQWVDPLDEIEPQLDAAQGEARRAILKAAYGRAEAGPPVYGEPSGRAYYASTEGVAVLVWVALRRNHPELTPEGAAELAGKMTPAEYSQLWRLAHGSNTLKSLERLLGLGGAKRAAQEQTWGELIDEVCQSHPGWTYKDVYGLTVTEFTNARRMGEPIEAGVTIPIDGNMMAAMAEQRRKWEGEAANAAAPLGGVGESDESTKGGE